MKTSQTDVRSLALAQFRKDWPLMAAPLQSMREAVSGGAGSGSAACAAAGFREFVTPSSNTGVNKVRPVAQVVV